MPTPLLLSSDDQAFVDSVKTDARLSNSDGISIDTNGDGSGDTPYCTDLPLPVKNFNAILPPGSENEKKLEDGLRAAAAPLALRVRPFGLHAEVAGTVYTTSGTTPLEILTASFAPGSKLAVERQAMVVVNLSAYATSTNVFMQYWVQVDGTDTTKRTFGFTEANAYRSVSGSWILTLPARTSNVKLFIQRLSGAGNIAMNSGTSADMTVWG